MNIQELKEILYDIQTSPDYSDIEKKDIMVAIRECTEIPKDILTILLDENMVEACGKRYKCNKKTAEYGFYRSCLRFENDPHVPFTIQQRLRRKLHAKK